MINMLSTPTKAQTSANRPAACLTGIEKSQALLLLKNCIAGAQAGRIGKSCIEFERTVCELVSSKQLPLTFWPSAEWANDIRNLSPNEKVEYAVALGKPSDARAPNIETIEVAKAIGLQIDGKPPETPVCNQRVSTLAESAAILVSEAYRNVEAHILAPEEVIREETPDYQAYASPAKNFRGKKLEEQVFPEAGKKQVFENVKATFKSYFKSSPFMEEKAEATINAITELFVLKGALSSPLFHGDDYLKTHLEVKDVSGRKLALVKIQGKILSRVAIDIAMPNDPHFVNLDTIVESGRFLDRFKPSSNGHADAFQPAKDYLAAKAKYKQNCKN